MKTRNRIDPDDLTAEDLREVEELLSATFGQAMLTNGEGHSIPLPKPVFDILSNILVSLMEGKPIMVVPLEEPCTTQAAANYLGMSRPYLNSLLDRGIIPCFKVGSHRRVKMGDLVEYEKQRDKERRERLDSLVKTIQADGLDEGDE